MNFVKNNAEDECSEVGAPWLYPPYFSAPVTRRKGSQTVEVAIAKLSVRLSKIRRTTRPALSDVVGRLAERWAIPNQEIATLLGLESGEMASDFLDGSIVLRGRDQEDRVANLFRIYEAIFGLFRDATAERRWIRQPIQDLRGSSCLDVMLNGGIEDLVDVRRAVEHIAGR